MRREAGAQVGLEDGFSSGLWGVGQPPNLEEKLGLEEKLTLGMGQGVDQIPHGLHGP